MRKIKKSFALALALTVLLVSTASPSMANDSNVGLINKSQAKGIARQYLRQIGFGNIGTSIVTAVVKDAELRDDTWVVNVLYGGTFPNKNGVVLVDRATGKVNQKSN